MTWPNALLTLYLATTRKSSSGRVLGEDLRMSIDQALRAVTIDAAYQLRLDDRIGSIAPNKYADFVVLREDPRSCEPDRLKDLEILATYVEGRRIWGKA
jgi:predicted amidohydrolase YtcJ